MHASPRLAASALDPAATRLVRLLDGRAAEAPPLAFTPLARAPEPVAAAVDGSHAVLADGRSLLAGAWRAAAVRTAPGAAPRVVREAGIEILTEEDATKVEAPPGASGLGWLLEARRAEAEVALARRALEGLPSGSVLLLDGPLAWRDPAPSRAAFEALLADAAARRVDVVGVCKSTALAVGAEPALAHVRRRARAEAPEGPWFAPLPVQPGRALAVAYAARLDAAQRWLFRHDVAPAPGRTAADALASLVPLAGTATYPGYPFPLALAHNSATMGEAESSDLKAALRARAEAFGLEAEAWEAAFGDYHDVLEGGA